MCHRGLGPTDLDRLAELLRACAEPALIDPRTRDGVIALAVNHLRREAGRFSEVFELSAQLVRGQQRLFRFSLAFPGYRRSPAAAWAFAEGLADLYGEPMRLLFDRALTAAMGPSVEQPIIGLEDAGGGAFRTKLYLQFTGAAGAAAVSIAAQLFGAPRWKEQFAGQSLHMIGIDIGPAGAMGAKLYVDPGALPLDAPWLASSGLAADLREAGVRVLTDALAIHRFSSPDDERGNKPSEVDFALMPNELGWAAIRSLPRLARVRPTLFDGLESRFRLGVRRLSFEAQSDEKLTVYYVLAEEADRSVESAAPRPAKSPARRLDRVSHQLFEPLFHARSAPDVWKLVSCDSEQGISVVFGRGAEFVLVELEARNTQLDCYARTQHFNVCARSQFTTDGSLSREQRVLVEAVVRLVRAREAFVEIDDARPPEGGEVREILVDRMLVPEGLGRYYLNPYAGCLIGCSFCYVGPRAELSRRIEGMPPPAWGRWVDVKLNAREVLEREVQALPPGMVRMSPILTDPYQPVERKYRIVRQCLQVLIDAGFGPTILTRESRVLEDLPLLVRGHSAVGFSIPTDDDGLRQIFEPKADTVENRFAALRQCAEAGLVTCLVVQPALPMNVDRFIEQTARWVKFVRIDRMHFGERVAQQYAAAGIPHATAPAFTEELIGRLRSGFRSAGVEIDERDDLGGMIEQAIRPAEGWRPAPSR